MRKRGWPRLPKSASPSGVRTADMTEDRAATAWSLSGLGKVTLCECWLRDGIQGWPDVIPTDRKIAVLEAMIDAGVAEADVTSFVSRRLVPQMADGEDLLFAIGERLRTRVLTVTVEGARRVADAHRTSGRIDRCGIPFSVSEAHNLANLRRTHADNRQVLPEIFAILRDAGIEPLLGVVTAFGCPIRGRVAQQEALDVAAWGVDHGIRSLMFGDTTGMANPGAAFAMFSAATGLWPEVELIAHFHDNRGCGIANSLAALAGGAQTVDGSFGGCGGEPKGVQQNVVGDQGNTASEDLLAVLDELGVQTGIDTERFLAAGLLAEQALGTALFSRVQRSGLAAHVGQERH
ncbi:MAG TPA: hydroxymethylglutaryl-CoA lyase [Paracoccus sp.]|nr:hydroxymethylglutaryl-CoA lyase [Paracoccus sp. (in: a-proteobacteria)]